MPDDVLAEVKAALAKMTPGPWTVEFGDQGCPIMAGDDAVCVMVADVDDAYGVAALVNAAPALVERCEMAESSLEAQFRFGYRMGVSRGSNDETEDDVVRLWKHKREAEDA